MGLKDDLLHPMVAEGNETSLVKQSAEYRAHSVRVRNLG
jgi:hypothetical protein